VVKEEWRDAQGKIIRDDNELLQLLYYPEDYPDRAPLSRTLKELKVPELGPVVFPAYDSTDVGVRSGVTTIDLGRLRSDPAERSRLARALWIAEGPHEEDDPSTSREDVPDDEPATGHSESDDDKPPAGHSSEDTTRSEAISARAAEMLGRMEITLARVRKDI
jgi:hypothetical protein